MPTSIRFSRPATVGRAALLICCIGLGACSTYADHSLRLRDAAIKGDRSAAIALIDKEDESDLDLLALLQRGLLHYEEGQYAAAIADFARAETVLDESFTKSITKEALAFLTNDATRSYVPYPSEQVLLNVYAGLSYLGLGDRQGALVEFRKVGQRLAALEDLRADAEAYHDDPFVQWLAAMLFADDRDPNACLVSCRRALAAFEEEAEVWELPIPEDFLQDYYDWARRFGFDDEAAALAERFPGVETAPRSSDEGEIVLIYACGWVDHLEELRTDFPILESDDPSEDQGYAREVWRRGHRGHFDPEGEVEIEYWLSVAVPVLVGTDEEIHAARILVGDRAEDTTMVSDVSAVFDLTFEEGEGRRMVRTIARALAKYLAVEAVKNEKDGKENKVEGFLANLFTSATERADTRSWTLLPDTFQMAKLRLPEGRYTVRVELYDTSGHVARSVEIEDLQVWSGRHSFLYQRSYR